MAQFTIQVTDTTLKLRGVEQRIINMIGGTTFYNHVKVKSKDNDDDYDIQINVKKSHEFITARYNLCLPTQEQIIPVEPKDDIAEIQRVLQRGLIEDCVTKGSHLKHFILGKPSGLRESEVVQLKSLKVESTERYSFATRIVNEKNKFSSYISGFANHRGGHIYYGIHDKGIVTGAEILAEKDKEDITKEVAHAINKLIWTERRITPERGVNWEIYFEEVKDSEEAIVDSTYVVVLFVSCCRGGVFIAEPESYCIKQGQVERIEFKLWWKSFQAGAFSKYYIKPSRIGSITWSSDRNMEFFVKLSEKLVDHRDAGDINAFDSLCKMAVTNFKERNAELIVKAGKITIAYKGGEAEVAQKLLHEFESLLSSSEDRSIFEVRLRLSESLVARSVGDYEKSYRKSEEGLQLAQNNPPGLCILWLYLECAMNAACLGFQNQDNAEGYDEKKREALVYLEEAARVANTLTEEDIPFRINDFQHKLRIYKAWILLNYSVSGEAATITPNQNDLDVARITLTSVFNNKLEGKCMSIFRKIEYYLVKCDYYTRFSEVSKDKAVKQQALQYAIKQVTKAIVLAEKHIKFKNLLKYAKKRCTGLEERVKLLKENLSTNRMFEGFEY